MRVPQLFRYFGSKTRMQGAISTLVPADTRVLVSLFVGSGVFEYNYAEAHPECTVVCYDVDPAVVNFHQQVETDRRRVALHAAILSSHAELSGRGAVLEKGAYTRLMAMHRADPHQTGRQAAVRFYLLCAYSFNGKLGSFAAKPAFRLPTALEKPLPPNLRVLQGEALSVLEVLPLSAANTCVYLDPPYVLPRRDYYTRSALELDHAALAARLRALEAVGIRWVLSYNDVPEVGRLYRGCATLLRLPVFYTYHRGGRALTQKGEVLAASFRVTPATRRAVWAAYGGHVTGGREGGGRP